MKSFINRVSVILLTLSALAFGTSLVGCEEKLVDVETPAGDFKINENADGSIEVEANGKE